MTSWWCDHPFYKQVSLVGQNWSWCSRCGAAARGKAWVLPESPPKDPAPEDLVPIIRLTKTSWKEMTTDAGKACDDSADRAEQTAAARRLLHYLFEWIAWQTAYAGDPNTTMPMPAAQYPRADSLPGPMPAAQYPRADSLPGPKETP